MNTKQKSNGIRVAADDTSATAVAAAPQADKSPRPRGIRFARGEFNIGRSRLTKDETERLNEQRMMSLEARVRQLQAELDGDESDEDDFEDSLKRFSRQTPDEGEASIHDLLAEFPGTEALRFHKMGYTMEAARYEHRQLHGRYAPTCEDLTRARGNRPDSAGDGPKMLTSRFRLAAILEQHGHRLTLFAV